MSIKDRFKMVMDLSLIHISTVLALLIVVAGLVTLGILPIAQYPDITPPTVQVSACLLYTSRCV